VTGLNLLTIVATGANGFEAGKDYNLVITTGTVSTVSVVGEVIGTFSLSRSAAAVDLANTTDGLTALYNQIGVLSVGAGGISVVAGSATVTTGTETLTYTSTAALDGATHDVAASGGNTEFYYEFDVGVTGVSTEVIWDGYVQSQGDTVAVYGYDWVAAGWVQIGSISGTNGSTVIEERFIFTSAMTGTGANAGTVRFRFLSTTITEIFTDRVLCEYTALPEAGTILHSGVAQSGSSNTIQLDTGANATDGFYNHARVVISSGTGSEQERIIVNYTGSTKTAKVAPPWVTNPDSTSAFEVEPATVHSETDGRTVKVGLAAAATSTTITLDSDASTTDDYYNEQVIHIDAGTGAGESRVITDYVGSTKVATVSRAWFTTPDTTSEYIIEDAMTYTECISPVALAQVSDGVWDEVITAAGHNVTGSAGRYLRQTKEGIVAEETAVNDAGATTTTFITNLTEASNDHYNDSSIVFIDGALKGQTRTILDYVGSTKQIVLDEALTEAPADGDGFILLSVHVHPLSAIADAVADEALSGHTTAGTLGKAITDIEGKTNSLTFTTAGEVDANIQSVNDTAVDGTGADGDEWGPV
jgi:hypothetical protein